MSAPGDMGTALISVNVPDDPQIGSETLYLPPISNIEVAYYTNLTELPTVVMGYRNNFIIDLGTTLKISLTMKRVNPIDYDDSNRSDPSQWSNGKWYRHLEDILDYWQNFGRDGSNNMTGGFLFSYTPSDSSLYPPINRNVFLNGSLSVQYSTQYMVVQMNLTVARMKENTTLYRYVTIVCHSGYDNVPDVEVEVLADIEVTVPNPIGWGPDGYTLMGWATSEGGSMQYAIGSTTVWAYRTTPYELWAIWGGGPKFIKYWTDPVSSITYSPSEDWSESQEAESPIENVRVIIVGGGGGAGGSAWTPVPGRACGGGGGGGAECYYSQWSASRTTTYTITVGKGGSHGDSAGVSIVAGSGTAGSAGDVSTVIASNGFAHTSEAGQGGQGGPWGTGDQILTAAGGQRVYAGGTAGFNGTWTQGQSGSTASPNVQENAGYGSMNAGTRGGGGGGGAANCNYSFPIGGATYNFVSLGGDAYGTTDRNGNRQTPMYGGGGGGSSTYSDGTLQDGATGLVVLVFY